MNVNFFSQDAHKGIAAADKYKGVVDCFTRVHNEQVGDEKRLILRIQVSF